MGLGHVPPRPLSRDCPGPHLPRRERREAGEDGAQALSDRRTSVGAAGERFAAWWLTQQGLSIVASNVEFVDGEIDLVARDGRQRVVVEVRAVTKHGDPIDAVSGEKRHHVRRLAARIGATRVDFLGVSFRDAVIVHWVPG